MKKILFITGTRADYGKLKALMKRLEESKEFELLIYVSGMHLLEQYGMTIREIYKDGFKNIYPALGQQYTTSMSYNLGNIICNLTGYVNSMKPDMIVIHGDRIEAMAGAIVGALNNIRVAHIEGGEVTGTIDESIRHAVSKFAHFHFVSNEHAKANLIQLGEDAENIYIIGSPDIDVMASSTLPPLAKVCKRYDIAFTDYSILMYHPVTTELDVIYDHIKAITDAIKKQGGNYVIIYPNNDSGAEIILSRLNTLSGIDNFRILNSMRFEYFLTLLKNAKCLIGNSSAGIHEAGFYGVPVIDLGTRQKGRYKINEFKNIQWCSEETEQILNALTHIEDYREVSLGFGSGNSAELFIKVLQSNIWEKSLQKRFIPIQDTV
ncbi:UDP-N-acetylglucosamine 2-epimerase [Butyrivibrio fibrisolvens]|uniref:UDP-N-acetylglucosamine 2-epimerase n=1 Tax=Butyrivibrio fibrisolvens TaxID=831 RepID=UPI000412F7B3|nr:UDP-N-acetylglucosamine 2-epimerase [Butyrivibrio fibrisolvens]